MTVVKKKRTTFWCCDALGMAMAMPLNSSKKPRRRAMSGLNMISVTCIFMVTAFPEATPKPLNGIKKPLHKITSLLNSLLAAYIVRAY